MSKTKQVLKVIVLSLAMGGMAGCAATDDRRATGQVVDDAALTARVKAALIKADNVNASAVNVNTYRGEFVLSGFVDNLDMARRAGEAARAVDGVRVLRNDLRVGATR